MNETSEQVPTKDARQQHTENFYKENYSRFNDALCSKNIKHRYQAACSLLGINSKLLKKKEQQEQRKFIAKKFRSTIKPFHPDKLGQAEENIKEKAKDICGLIENAKSIILETLPQQSKKLTQQSYEAQYQYELDQDELRNKNLGDPYYYIHMACSNDEYSVIKSWRFENPAETSTSSQIDVSLQPRQRTVKMKGCEAFYHLWRAGALPNQLDQGHLSLIFPSENNSFDFNHQWLLQKIFNDPDSYFIMQMDTYDVCNLAIAATKLNIARIGLTPTKVFIYYYLNRPETLYGERVKKFMRMGNFNKNQLANAILQNPENLIRLSSLDQLIDLNDEFRHYILSHEKLTLQLSDYYLDYEMMLPHFKKTEPKVESFSNVKDIFHVSLRQLLYNNPSFLVLFNKNTIFNLKNYISENKNVFPSWLAEKIDLELAYFDFSELNYQEIKNQLLEDFTHSHDDPIDAYDFLKKAFLKDDPDEVVNFLNKEALLHLVDDPDVHWSRYLSIANALIELNEIEAAKVGLHKIAEALNIEFSAELSVQEMKNVVTLEQEKMEAAYSNWRQEKISLLLEKYESVLKGEEKGEHAELKEQLNISGATDQATRCYDQCEKECEKQVKQLWKRLAEGENSEELKAAFKNAGKTVFARKDKSIDPDKLLDETIFNLFGRVLLGSDYDRPNEDYGHNESVIPENFEIYGVKQNESLIKNLQRLFFIYDCVRGPDEFYKTLKLHLSEFDLELPYELNTFDEKTITDCLLRYSKNEFAVYIAGKRENIRYKQFYIDGIDRDIHRVKTFGTTIYRLFEQLNKIEHLESLLPDAYQQLLGQEQKANDGERRRPLLVYEIIRGHTEKKHDFLENLIIQYKLRDIFKKCLPTNESGFFQRSSNSLITFRRNIIDHQPNPHDEEECANKTKVLLSNLADFLLKNKNAEFCIPITKEILSDSILAPYFKELRLMNLSNITASHVEQLAYGIKTLASQPSLLALPAPQKEIQYPMPTGDGAAIEKIDGSTKHEEGNAYQTQLTRLENLLDTKKFELNSNLPELDLHALAQELKSDIEREKKNHPEKTAMLTAHLKAINGAIDTPNAETITALKKRANEMQSNQSPRCKAIGISMMILGAGLAILGGIFLPTPFGIASLAGGLGIFAAGATLFGVSRFKKQGLPKKMKRYADLLNEKQVDMVIERSPGP